MSDPDRQPVQIEVRMLKWDAREMFPAGLEGTCAEPDDLETILESMAGAMASLGQVIVLPGPEPHQALIVAMDGEGDGYAQTGMSRIDWGPRAGGEA